ncbi:MAG: orotidine-5'-phosphate decarboxylase [Fidelibacterota bacterium]
MNFLEILNRTIDSHNSHLCVGLDIDPDRINTKSKMDVNDLSDYSRKVIDATREYASAYKPNMAFFERWGSAGIEWLEETIEYIGHDHFLICDGKRGDISNSARQYAKSVFDHFGFDASTVSPYMGSDAIRPFLEDPGKGAFVLSLTSNDSARELQLQRIKDVPLYDHVITMCNQLNKHNNCGLVVGATRESELEKIRMKSAGMPFLIPGVGIQGGDLETCVRIGNTSGIALVNVSRSILYAGNQSSKAIKSAARGYRDRVNRVLES